MYVLTEDLLSLYYCTDVLLFSDALYSLCHSCLVVVAVTVLMASCYLHFGHFITLQVSKHLDNQMAVTYTLSEMLSICVVLISKN